MIIGIAGRKHSGKDTVARRLIWKHGFQLVSLADPMKKMLAHALDVNVDCMYNQTLKEAGFKNLEETLPDNISNNELTFLSSNIESLIRALETLYPLTDDHKCNIDRFFRSNSFTSFRDLLQKFGTECCRDSIDKNLWIKILQNQLHPFGKYVIADVRYPNERKFIRDNRGLLILLKRKFKNTADTHASENQLGTEKEYDLICRNNLMDQDKTNDVIEEWLTTGKIRRKYLVYPLLKSNTTWRKYV